MTQTDFDTFSRNFMSAMTGTLTRKGADYSQDNDRLSNFKINADRLGLTSRQVFMVYMMKYVDAILTWARTGRVASEDIYGRFMDLANYSILGAALAQELDPVSPRLPAPDAPGVSAGPGV